MSVSTLTADYRKPDTTLRCETLYVDGDIDCNAIHARSIIPDPTNDLVCDKLTSNSIENTNGITTTDLIASGDVKSVNLVSDINILNAIVGFTTTPETPIVLPTNIRNQVIRFTGINLGVAGISTSTGQFEFSLGAGLNISNYIFTANIVNTYSNQDNIALVASIANTSPIIYTNVKRVMITNLSILPLINGNINILISLVKNDTD
jgi:hypothetical protein